MGQTARELLDAGDALAALKALQQEVRDNAGDVRLRIFLAQLLCVLGQWQRALDQFKVCAELDAGTLAMVNTYTTAVQCEALREAVFAGRVLPHVFGPPTAWVAQLAQALQVQAQGDHKAAAAMREQALEEAPACAGHVELADGNGHAFEWIADADSRVGPALEIIINGRYGWLPLQHCAALVLDPVEDLRDLVWAPAQLTLANGGQSVALVPTRYAGTPVGEGGPLALSRRTEWLELGDNQFRGLGQRLLTTDQAELGLLDLRQLRMDLTEPAAQS